MTTTLSLSGWRSRKFIKKRTKVVRKIDRLDIAMAGFVGNTNIAMMFGMATPPPPMPAMFDKAMITAKTIMPPISSGSTGKTSL